MAFRLSYYKAAKDDIVEAKAWYHSQLHGLEKRFAKDLQNTISRLVSNPFAHAIRYEKFRITHADIFPYSIHFYIDDVKSRIIIVGIVHDRRDSSFIRNRD